MKWIYYGLTATIFGLLFIFAQGCVTPGEVNVENSLPEKQIAYYNDPFETLREDLWDRAGYVRYETQLENLKLADMMIDDGKLVIKTKTGGYSKGGLASRFALRGDFDIQIDCHLDFFQDTFDMDQVVNFVVVDKTCQYDQINLVTIGLIMRGTSLKSGIYMGYRELGKYAQVNATGMGDFNGSLRILRTGSDVKSLYREGEDGKWHDLGTVSFNANDVMVGLIASNFIVVRWNIGASKSITATFDNFRINAAQGIIEEEI
jgi:hypothetical protein